MMEVLVKAAAEVSKKSLENMGGMSSIEKTKDLPRTPALEVEVRVTDSPYVKCRNEGLAGQTHEVSGVPFEQRAVELPNGTIIEGVFPEFDHPFEATLDETLYEARDARQFREANEQLKEAVQENPDLRDMFTEEQLEEIEYGDTPDGYVWHHGEEPGSLQLVDKTIHEQTAHTGGRSIWGGGSINR